MQIELFMIIRKDMDLEYDLHKKIRIVYPEVKVIILDGDTDGATETVMCAEEILDPNLPLLILDCDLFFESFYAAINRIFRGTMPQRVSYNFAYLKLV